MFKLGHKLINHSFNQRLKHCYKSSWSIPAVKINLSSNSPDVFCSRRLFYIMFLLKASVCVCCATLSPCGLHDFCQILNMNAWILRFIDCWLVYVCMFFQKYLIASMPDLDCHLLLWKSVHMIDSLLCLRGCSVPVLCLLGKSGVNFTQ